MNLQTSPRPAKHPSHCPGVGRGRQLSAAFPQVSRTRYATCGELDIAYQTVGDGPTDLLVLPGPFIPIDTIDAEPSMARFHRRLATFGRVIRFDHRGTGLSSHLPVAAALGPKVWAEDAIAVMDAVGCDSATVLVSSYMAMTGLMLAAEHPERVSSLLIVNGAPGVRDRDTGEPDPVIAQGFDSLAVIAPSIASDAAFRSWWELAGHRAATPSMAVQLTRVVVNADVCDVLPRLAVPTLILHRTDCAFVDVRHGRYLAEHIPGARYVELPGADTLYWVGDTTPVLDEIEEFVTGVRGGFSTERALATILFTDIVSSTERLAALGDDRWRDLLDSHDMVVRHELDRFGGREVSTAGDGFVAVFGSPSIAIDCADAVIDAACALGLDVRVGMHTGEVELRGADVAGMAVHIAARVVAFAQPNEVLVSSTVREIVTGSRRGFTASGEHELKGVPGRWRLYSLLREHAMSAYC